MSPCMGVASSQGENHVFSQLMLHQNQSDNKIWAFPAAWGFTRDLPVGWQLLVVSVGDPGAWDHRRLGWASRVLRLQAALPGRSRGRQLVSKGPLGMRRRYQLSMN